MTFKFKCKKENSLLWKTYKVSGFKRDGTRMCLFFEDGTTRELCEWDKYDCILGRDYFDAVKKIMEEKAGQSIPTNEVRK